MVALGRGVEDEYRDNLHKISRQLTGERGLLFTNQSKDEVLKYVNLPAHEYKHFVICCLFHMCSADVNKPDT